MRARFGSSPFPWGSRASGAARRRPNFIVVSVRRPGLRRHRGDGAQASPHSAPRSDGSEGHAAHGFLCRRESLHAVACRTVDGPLSDSHRALPTKSFSRMTLAVCRSPRSLSPRRSKPEYATALIGKWHLGHVAPFWPPTHAGLRSVLRSALQPRHQAAVALREQRPGRGAHQGRRATSLSCRQRFCGARGTLHRSSIAIGRSFWSSRSARRICRAIRIPIMRVIRARATYGDVVEEVDAIVGRSAGEAHGARDRARHPGDVYLRQRAVVRRIAGNLRQRKGGGGYGRRLSCSLHRSPALGDRPCSSARSISIAMAIDLLPTFCRHGGEGSARRRHARRPDICGRAAAR